MPDAVLFVAGLAGLLLGGDLLVRGAVAMSQRLGVPPLVIGLTVVGFGTSMPELLTSLQAALAGSPGIALGNVIGSNTANILLILGVAAVIAPLPVARAAFGRDGAVLAAATALCIAVAFAGGFGRVAGALFLAWLAAYLVVAFRAAPEEPAPDLPAPRPLGWGWALVLFAGGLALTIAGAQALVGAAISIARDLAVPETVIGLTIVAVGTSLPELVTSITAARRGETQIAFGNVIGSNIFNILGILGLTALVRPLEVPPELASVDLWVMAGATALLGLFALSGWRVTRGEGAALLAVYALYIGFQVLRLG